MDYPGEGFVHTNKSPTEFKNMSPSALLVLVHIKGVYKRVHSFIVPVRRRDPHYISLKIRA